VLPLPDRLADRPTSSPTRILSRCAQLSPAVGIPQLRPGGSGLCSTHSPSRVRAPKPAQRGLTAPQAPGSAGGVRGRGRDRGARRRFLLRRACGWPW
jgi:hypothetical protein